MVDASFPVRWWGRVRATNLLKYADNVTVVVFFKTSSTVVFPTYPVLRVIEYEPFQRKFLWALKVKLVYHCLISD